jgi:AraC family transcriptional regulator, arabinose operon regulatory protein
MAARPGFRNGAGRPGCGKKHASGRAPALPGEHRFVAQLPTVPLQILEAAWGEISSWNHRDTAAPWWRWYWNDRPGWTARFAGTSYRLTPERVVLIAPDTNFLAESTRSAGHLHFHFVAGPPFHKLRRQIHVVPIDDALDKGARDCRRWLDQRDVLRAALAVPALCSFALARLDPPPAVLDERMWAIMSFIEEHVMSDLTNERLAALCDMHPNSFIRWFKRAFDATPRAFVTHRKVERACSLLRFTSLGIEQIAEELGFCDRYYFSRVFKRHRGRTPSQFRKQAI